VLGKALGLLFLVSGISKLISPVNFIKEVEKINFLFPALTVPAVYGFILVELVLAFFLIFKRSNRVLMFTIMLILFFCVYLGCKVVVNDTSDCGCFGNIIYRSNIFALIQDLFILMTAVYLLEPKKTTPAGAEAEEKEGT
jgi:uncharacterized membrane protein YphA (DoxX/SURF4 family)